MSDQRRQRRLRELVSAEKAAVVAFLSWTAYAHWQLARAYLFGSINRPWRIFGRDILLADDPRGFWSAVAGWTFVGPVIITGITVFLWLQRHDRF